MGKHSEQWRRNEDILRKEIRKAGDSIPVREGLHWIWPRLGKVYRFPRLRALIPWKGDNK